MASRLARIEARPSMPYVAGGNDAPLGVMMNPEERDLLVAAVRQFAETLDGEYGPDEWKKTALALLLVEVQDE